ncbi:hypothetical protein QQS21_006391 [Conoideocrella luteorostrata]|uniref:Glyoxalase-like domain-containing protein n=1 Tax=Conoideocrella luteorostrata TaxID=1105319 RepID=A0AAJ0FYB2_9HYPO|nr:hypothetical protein QQS21_006391 [Conoideocrella luteorostrata]
MLEIGSIVWGVRSADNFPLLIQFWCAALDYKPARAPDTDWAILVPKASAEARAGAGAGKGAGAGETTATDSGPSPIPSPSPSRGHGQQMALSVVTSTNAKRQRHHLDLYASDQKAEIERLVGLGASLAEREYPDDADYVVLEDPDGNAFCVIQK